MSMPIAVVGIACRYPDASSPAELWENVLAGRRAFRRIPDERLRLEDYWSADRTAPDRIYSDKAAVIEGFEFDRVKYKIAGSTYRTTDLTHWLALDTAARALEDAGYPDGEGLPKTATAVIIGNTLTGEFTRANLMRLRWPYVRRTVGTALKEMGWDDNELATFLSGLEARYKSAFPPVDEDTLAGGLANTIAGRICNQFDFKGGGFTVDGACSSSLLSVLTACTALSDGLSDAAVAGGVDLSIDPFETIGFAKTGALAAGEMRVYDRHSNGFWPGEGCGMLVLMRQDDAEARGLRIYATIAGWGYSSDGKGGITRPEAAGHRLALSRAYQLAGFDIDTVGYLEGHGTGTAVGDATELGVFTEARRAASPAGPTAAISTIKGNIGHTKAAAGVAGLIKATMAVHNQIIPPATGHTDPHPILTGDSPALRVPGTAELWPQEQPIRAGVSSMGFGGINAHVVLAAHRDAQAARRTGLDSRTIRLVSSRQDSELLLLDAASPADLSGRVASLAVLCRRLAFAELGDLAATLARELGGGAVRAAVVASTPDQAAERLAALAQLLDGGASTAIDVPSGLFLGRAAETPRIGYLFPGQGSGKGTEGALRRRFAVVRDLGPAFSVPAGGDPAATAIAQPRIARSSVEGLRVLALLGIEAEAAVGHSLGELTALHWAGAMDEAGLLALATERGRVMTQASEGGGAMASIAAGPDQVEPLLPGANGANGSGGHSGSEVVIAGYNGPAQTVISGPAEAVDRVCRAAAAADLVTSRIPVSHAFHSPMVAPAAAGLQRYLTGLEFKPLTRRVLSTVTGDALQADADLRELLVRQVREPVSFSAAASQLAATADLLIEVGPGRVLSSLAAGIAPDVPVIPLDTDGTSLSGVLSAAAAAYALGAPVKTDVLFADRFTRPLPLDKQFRFFASPCESAPADSVNANSVTADSAAASPLAGLPANSGTPNHGPFGENDGGQPRDSLQILQRLAAERAELPIDSVHPDSHPLDELHMSSITVGQIMNQAARELGVSAPMVTSAFATATLADLAQALDELADTALPGDADVDLPPEGIGPWVRAFSVELIETARRTRVAAQADGTWEIFSPPGHPLSRALSRALRAARLGDGVALLLPLQCGPEHIGLMLQAARAALSHSGSCRFVAVQDRRGAAGLAKTLHLEAPAVPVTVITLPLAAPVPAKRAAELADAIVADVAATEGFSEVHYDAAGRRRVPLLRPVMNLAVPGAELPLGPGDVLLVSGGGKGITAECALTLARDTGAAIALLGRSEPAADAELAANLGRMDAAGARYVYVQADVTAASELAAAVAQVSAELGPVTAILHGAGRNAPVPLAILDEAAFHATLAPKIGGLEALLAAVDPASLKLVITFGSIIGRAGLRGQADYATANEWLTDMTRRLQEASPQCRCVALEWSVWSGAGMGEKLGVLESLIREGISPISLDAGIEMLRSVLATPAAPSSLVVMSRSGGLPTITLEPSELPLSRFIDRPRVHYPGIELVADAELSADRDPYLVDHLLDGDLLFPAVLGMEAMAQAAAVLAGPGRPVALENVEFLRPIVVPPDGTVTIRIAALNRGDGVDVAIRSSDTGFQADHFRATLRNRGTRPFDAGRPVPAVRTSRVPLDAAADLYGGVFFQGKRFQRVLGYRRLAATSCVVEISAGSGDDWFGSYFSRALVLGDPGARDAFMHGIQCCVPNATLLPAGVERIYPAHPDDLTGQVILQAAERNRDGDTYTYDLDVCTEDGRILERWEGLRLQAVRKTDGRGPWIPALLGPFLERQAAELTGSAVRCAVEPDPPSGADGRDARRRQTKVAVGRMLDRPAVVTHRGDGKPHVADQGVAVSASHGGGVTLAVAGSERVGCDVERIEERATGDWQALLTAEQFALGELIQRERGEEPAAAATRVWGAVECLRKTGRALTGPITLAAGGQDGWVLLQSGAAKIATFVTSVLDQPDPVVFTILTEEDGNGTVLRVPARGGLRGDEPRRQCVLRQLRALAGTMSRDVPAGARAHRAR
ncbi:MAG TPA: SDR family NAD(P)-dependent oxidoreductase [Streptosporangiaceae bacterium]|nr:SDR family NAD(P)-dependent oxidoreductase [Streptosporangiaceae bacterium]